MKIVAIISQKDGAGKTTLSVHLATASTVSGHSAAIIDLDPQGTAASWGDRRQADAPEVVIGRCLPCRLADRAHRRRKRTLSAWFAGRAPDGRRRVFLIEISAV